MSPSALAFAAAALLTAEPPLVADPTPPVEADTSPAAAPPPALASDPRWTAARTALRKGRWAAAREALLVLAAERPDDALVHNELGVALVQERAFRAAVAAFERSVALDPERANAWANLGEARSRLGDATGAADAFRRALLLAPDDADARLGLARAAPETGPAAPATVAVPDAPSADPLSEARLAILAGEAWRARALLGPALTRSPRDAELLALRALVGVLEGDRPGARADVAAALAEDPRSVLATAVLLALDTPR